MLSSTSFADFLVFVRSDFDECAFRHVAAADILVDEDEAVADEDGRGAEALGVMVDAVGGDAVGRAVDEEGIGLRSVFGDVDGGEEFGAVAHGDAEFVLGVVFADFGGGGVGVLVVVIED